MVEQIARSTGSEMILEGPLVNLAGAACGIDREHDTPGCLAEQVAVALATDVGTSEIHLQGSRNSLLLNLGGVDMEGGSPVTPFLNADVMQLCIRSQRKVIHRNS